MLKGRYIQIPMESMRTLMLPTCREQTHDINGLVTALFLGLLASDKANRVWDNLGAKSLRISRKIDVLILSGCPWL